MRKVGSSNRCVASLSTSTTSKNGIMGMLSAFIGKFTSVTNITVQPQIKKKAKTDDRINRINQLRKDALKPNQLLQNPVAQQKQSEQEILTNQDHGWTIPPAWILKKKEKVPHSLSRIRDISVKDDKSSSLVSKSEENLVKLLSKDFLELPEARLPEHAVVHIAQTKEEIEPALKQIIALENKLRKQGDAMMIGFDCEWVPCQKDVKNIDLLQIAFEHSVLLIRLCRLNFKPTDPAPSILTDLLLDPKILKFCQSPSTESNVLQRQLFLSKPIPSLVDIERLGKSYDCKPFSLVGNVALFMKQRLRKHPLLQCSNWSQETLSKKQIDYAALDAWISRQVGIDMLNSFSSQQKTTFVEAASKFSLAVNVDNSASDVKLSEHDHGWSKVPLWLKKKKEKVPSELRRLREINHFNMLEETDSLFDFVTMLGNDFLQLPEVRIPGSVKVHVTNSVIEAERILTRMILQEKSSQSQGLRFIGIDSEFVSFDGPPKRADLLQIGFESAVLLIRLNYLNQSELGNLSVLNNLLLDPQTVKFGQNLDLECQILQNQLRLGKPIPLTVDIEALGRIYQCKPRSLVGNVALFLNQRMRKIPLIQCSNWQSPSLSQKQVEYAALDAYMSRQVGLTMLRDFAVQTNSATLHEAIQKLNRITKDKAKTKADLSSTPL